MVILVGFGIHIIKDSLEDWNDDVMICDLNDRNLNAPHPKERNIFDIL